MRERLTKIVCTIGPASREESQLRELADAGMNVARVNLSHGRRDFHTRVVLDIKKINESRSSPIGIMLDTKGSEIRTGSRQEPLKVSKGEDVLFYPASGTEPTDIKAIEVSYDSFSEEVQESERILIDNGEISFHVLSVNPDGTVLAKAMEDGEIGDCRHINLPGADVDEPIITENDWKDITFAIAQEVDFIALSFIHTAADVLAVREYLRKQKSSVKLIAKIETQAAVNNIAEILEASDGIMVARGDLGAEVPFEELPAIQDETVSRCMNAGKPVLIATHMLESMKEHPIPTRAEMTDVAHAATTMADATMLSGETASGKHPTLVVEAMNKIISRAEEYISRFADRTNIHVHDEYESRAQAAVQLADAIGAPAILVFTRSGQTAQQVSKFRPKVPIISCTNSVSTLGHMTLLYGTIPLRIAFADAQETIQNGIQAATKARLLQKGSRVIVVSDIPKDRAEWSIQLKIVS